MRKPILTIFYQYNPWRASIGGIQTIIDSFIKYAPEEFEVRLVGATNSSMHLGQWYEMEFLGRNLLFMPLVNLQNDNVRKTIPTTLKYTLALLGKHFQSDFMHFHRLEPTLASLPWSADKTLFIHNDIHQQIVSKDSKNAILWRRFPGLYFAFEQLLVNQFSQILSCNSESVNLYRERYPIISDKVNFVRNSVDDEVFNLLQQEDKNRHKTELAKKLGLPLDTQFVLFAGRLHPQKDPLLLIHAIAALNDPSIHLLIAGEGELAFSISSEINRLQLTKQVTMLGAVDRTNLAKLHFSSSLCILTSLYEGLPLVVLEALSCGTPVVTTNCGETPKILSTGSGVVCSERTPQAIADSMRKVLSSPQDFRPETCAQVAQPYKASQVVADVYSDMLKRWKN